MRDEGAKPTLSQCRRHSDKVIFGSLIFIVAIAPLPLGSASPLSAAIVAIATSATLICWALSLGLGLTRLHVATSALKWPVFIYLAVCSWIFIQWAPWTPVLFADPIWQSTSEVLTLPLHGSISVNPDATITGLLNLFLYGGIFWLTFQMTQSSERAWTLIHAVTYIGSAYATYGIVIYMTGNEWVAIYPKTSYLNSLTSTFVNRNSYATFAGLTLLSAAVLLLNYMKPYFALRHPIRVKLVIITEELVEKSALKTSAALSIAISLLLTASRAGTFSSAIGLITLIIIFIRQQKLKTQHVAYAVATAVVLASILIAVSGNYFSKRLKSGEVDSGIAFRGYMYSLTWEAIKSSPLKGTGFGTYADVIPAYKEDRVNAPVQRWDKAHNTYLENAMELGLPAAAMLNISIALVALITAGGMSRRRRDKLIPALGVCATVLVALHSFVDFSLQIPAVAILYACIMGVAASQSWSATASNANQPEVAPTP